MSIPTTQRRQIAAHGLPSRSSVCELRGKLIGRPRQDCRAKYLARLNREEERREGVTRERAKVVDGISLRDGTFVFVIGATTTSRAALCKKPLRCFSSMSYGPSLNRAADRARTISSLEFIADGAYRHVTGCKYATTLYCGIRFFFSTDARSSLFSRAKEQ